MTLRRIASLVLAVAFSGGLLMGCGGKACKDLEKKAMEACSKLEGDTKKQCEDGIKNAGYEKMDNKACEAALEQMKKLEGAAGGEGGGEAK